MTADVSHQCYRKLIIFKSLLGLLNTFLSCVLHEKTIATITQQLFTGKTLLLLFFRLKCDIVWCSTSLYCRGFQVFKLQSHSPNYSHHVYLIIFAQSYIPTKIIYLKKKKSIWKRIFFCYFEKEVRGPTCVLGVKLT